MMKFNFFNKKDEVKHWLVRIEEPMDRSGDTYFYVYQGSKRIFVSSYKQLKKLIKKYKPVIYSLDRKTQNLLNVFEIENSIPEIDYDIR
jgi:hypothetical protein